MTIAFSRSNTVNTHCSADLGTSITFTKRFQSGYRLSEIVSFFQNGLLLTLNCFSVGRGPIDGRALFGLALCSVESLHTLCTSTKYNPTPVLSFRSLASPYRLRCVVFVRLAISELQCLLSQFVEPKEFIKMPLIFPRQPINR